MKTAIYIENGVTQLVLTPDNQWEKDVLKSIDQDANDVKIHRGGFYHCQGGWDRHESERDTESLMFRVTPRAKDDRQRETPVPVPGS